MKVFCGLVVYADDFEVCFQYKEEVEIFYKHLIRRLEHIGLRLRGEKIRLIKFGRYARHNANKRETKPRTFDSPWVYTLLFH